MPKIPQSEPKADGGQRTCVGKAGSNLQLARLVFSPFIKFLGMTRAAAHDQAGKKHHIL